MCFGPELAAAVPYIVAATSAVAGGAGTYSAAKASKLDAEAQYGARHADQLRQAALQKEADDRLKAEIGNFAPENAQDQVDIAAATRTAATPVAAAPPPQYQATPVSAPVEVKGDLDRRLGDVVSKAALEAKKRNQLAAYGDVSQQQGFGLNRIGENFRRLRGESAGSSNIMRVQSGLGDTASPGWRNRSDTANLIGQIGSLYAMGGGKKKPPTGYMSGLPGDV